MGNRNVLNFDLTDKVIIVTGGYGYLGSAIVYHLMYYNAQVVVAARCFDKFNNEFGDENDKISFQEIDISEEKSIVNGFKNIYENYGKIDGLINNAFYLSGNSPEQMTSDDFNNGVDGTLNSVFRCMKSIIPYFKNQKSGRIVNVSSMYGIQAPDFKIYEDSPQFLNPPHYGAAKAGVIQLSKYYASYLGNIGITVNSVTPGPFPSKIVQENTNFINDLKNKTVLGQIGNPEDLAGIFTFLVSNAASFITGQNFIIDGGWTIK